MNKYTKIFFCLLALTTIPFTLKAENINISKEMTYTSKKISDVNTDRENSTFIMKDDLDKLTQFDMERVGNKMTINIHQNGVSVWKKTYNVSNGDFRVSKKINNDKTSFLIIVGQYALCIEDGDDENHWKIVETDASHVDKNSVDFQNLKFEDMEIK